MLSHGGWAILIKYVLYSIPLHIIFVIKLPKTTIKQIEQLMANFFWSDGEGKKKMHWIAWWKLCFPTLEGGIGFRSIQDISRAFGVKI